MALYTNEYKAQLTEKHDKKPWGGAGKSWLPWILPRLQAGDDILDYGCGRGTLKEALESIEYPNPVAEYDPGVRGKDTPPTGQFDFVVCTDVLEHIEPECINDVMAHLRTLTRRALFLNIVYGPCKSTLPDGRNTHILQRPSGWWRALLRKYFPAASLEVIEDGNHRGVFFLVV